MVSLDGGDMCIIYMLEEKVVCPQDTVRQSYPYSILRLCAFLCF